MPQGSARPGRSAQFARNKANSCAEIQIRFTHCANDVANVTSPPFKPVAACLQQSVSDASPVLSPNPKACSSTQQAPASAPCDARSGPQRSHFLTCSLSSDGKFAHPPPGLVSRAQGRLAGPRCRAYMGVGARTRWAHPYPPAPVPAIVHLASAPSTSARTRTSRSGGLDPSDATPPLLASSTYRRIRPNLPLLAAPLVDTRKQLGLVGPKKLLRPPSRGRGFGFDQGLRYACAEAAPGQADASAGRQDGSRPS